MVAKKLPSVKNFLIVGAVMAIMIMVIAFSVMRTGDAKKKDKNKKSNDFGKT